MEAGPSPEGSILKSSLHWGSGYVSRRLGMSTWFSSEQSKKTHRELNREGSLLCRGRISHTSSTHLLWCKVAHFQHCCSTCPHCSALLGALDQGTISHSCQQTTHSSAGQLPKLRQFQAVAFSNQKQ